MTLTSACGWHCGIKHGEHCEPACTQHEAHCQCPECHGAGPGNVPARLAEPGRAGRTGE
jgi:hypothetical protein